ncbi:MAG: YggT family protein [Alphaproteobacteria bacterium]
MDVIIVPILSVIDILLGIYTWVLIISIIMSWLIAFNVINTYNGFVSTLSDILYRLTEPALQPIRRFLPSFSGLDLSPLVLILLIYFVRQVIGRLAAKLLGM